MLTTVNLLDFNKRNYNTVNKILVMEFYNGWLQYHLSQLNFGVWLLLSNVWNVNVWYMFNNMKAQMKVIVHIKLIRNHTCTCCDCMIIKTV